MHKVKHHDLWFMIHIIWNSDHHSPASLTSPLTVLDVGQPPMHQVTHTALDPWRVMLQPKSTSTEATSHKMSQVPGPWLRRNNEKWHWDTERCHIYKLSICWDTDPSKNLSSKGPPWAAQTWRRRKHQLEVEESVQRFKWETTSKDLICCTLFWWNILCNIYQLWCMYHSWFIIRTYVQ